MDGWMNGWMNGLKRGMHLNDHSSFFFFISLCFPFCFFTLFDFPQKRLGRMLTSLIDECEGEGEKQERD